ncbi:hypothetical protein [Flavobacterium sp.]|uniref:hypothetical protein n=1 Tax=Flavobacterium sp. TaxID=239 RepID=UPI003BD8F458
MSPGFSLVFCFSLQCVQSPAKKLAYNSMANDNLLLSFLLSFSCSCSTFDEVPKW